ncbi:glycosyl hydrolase family 18 protein [Stigmatella sp. ncwal1]|uniref:chitinase n=1 Tax=Stigmatella ashevillensis TaxID=2995309 RepID=A0ABT5D4Q4_9BACT|nr:glycosyl hydrolase family 18 protein [Stigmatella ashevillena]MDC0708103.1 glycosyl hydrolase family 18 protein [Stigmatella ashevillena]
MLNTASKLRSLTSGAALLATLVACSGEQDFSQPESGPSFEASTNRAGIATIAAAWTPNTSYSTGTVVTYGGSTYKCIQGHTSLEGWEPPNVPALWELQSGGSVDTQAPSVPANLTSPSKTSTSVSLSWSASNDNVGVTGYDVYRNGSLVGSTSSTSYTASGLTASTAYSFSIRAKDAAGNVSAASSTLSVTTNATGATCAALPSVPGGLSSPSKSSSSVSLAWSASSPGTNCTIAGYDIYNGSTRVGQTSGTGTDFTVSGLNANTAYTFSVAARNEFGASAKSGSLNVTTSPNTGGGGSIILGYFAQWGVYGRNYHVKNIVTSGSASKLTHINYSFGNVINGQCVLGDTYADYDRAYTAAESVDGVADTWDTGALRGSFNQLRKLKKLYPNIKVLFSFGGWTWSGGFGQAAANPAAFAESCYKLVEDPRWADVFDGIDIDWEYPNACGLSCDTSGPDAYVRLMSALRSRFGSNYLVTAAVPAGAGPINAANYGAAAQYINWYNVMTYDFFGAFAAQGPTAPHSALYSWPGMPTSNGQDKFYTDAAIQLFKSKGVPANKLLIGIGFYGRGWSGVQNTNGGLNQPATGAGTGTYEPGIEDYKVLVNRCPPTGTVAGTAMAFCGGQWWSYDTPSTIAGKMTYKKNQGLGGSFFWELSGDTANGELINALYTNR